MCFSNELLGMLLCCNTNDMNPLTVNLKYD